MPASPSAVAQDRGHQWNSTVHELLRLGIDAYWILFVFGVSGAAYRFGIPHIERYFWLSIDLAVAAALVLNPDLIRLALRHKIILSWAFLACLSYLWSLSPAISLYHGVQLFMTIMAGFLLAQYAERNRIMKLLFLAMFLAALLSLAINVLRPGQAVGWQGAWEGAFSHKNTLGAMMTLLAFTSLCLFLHGWRRLLTASGLALALFLLIQSRSGTAFIALIFVLSPLPLLWSLRGGRSQFAIALGITLLIAAAALMFLSISDIDLFDAALSGVGKDSTLSGRTMLWDFGIRAFLDRPLLGAGFKGFWEGDLATVQNLRFVMASDLWFFHNNFIEVAVAFGFIGPILLLLGIWVTGVDLLRVLLVDRDFAAFWPLLMILFIFSQCLSENPLIYNHSLHQLLFAAVAACHQPVRYAMPARAMYPMERNSVVGRGAKYPFVWAPSGGADAIVADEPMMPVRDISAPADKAADQSARPVRTVAFFGHDIYESTIIKRVTAFQAHRSRVVGFMFRRERDRPAQAPEWKNIDLGTTVDVNYLKRIPKLAIALVRILRNARLLRRADVIYARNIDMLLLAVLGKWLTSAPAAVVYEALDVRGVFIGNRPINKVFRWVERRLMAAIEMLVVSSPEFVTHYFQPVQNYNGAWYLLENKLVPQPTDGQGARRPIVNLDPIPPLVIGWFGVLKCKRSFEILCRIAEALEDRVEIYIRGIASESDVPTSEIEMACARLPNMTYGGPYRSPQDLPAIYGKIHVIWAADFLDAGANTHWCLPNRLYEGGFNGCAAIASCDTATGRMIDRHGLGWTLAEPLEETALPFFDQLDFGELERKRTAVREASISLFVDETDTRDLLNELDRLSDQERLRNRRHGRTEGLK